MFRLDIQLYNAMFPLEVMMMGGGAYLIYFMFKQFCYRKIEPTHKILVVVLLLKVTLGLSFDANLKFLSVHELAL